MRQRRGLRKLSATVAGAVFISLVGVQTPAHARTTIDTTSHWDGSTSIAPFGKPNTATYGQTFTAPVSGPVSSVTFLMKLPVHVKFRGYVYAWDGLRPTGPGYETDVLTTSNPNIYEPVTFRTNFPVTAGQRYIAFASISKEYHSFSNGLGSWGIVDTGAAHPGGDFVFNNNGADFSTLLSASWTQISRDAAFRVVIGGDITPPVITHNVSPAPNAAGWHSSDPTVSFAVSDPESGISGFSGCGTRTISGETAAHPVTCSVTNGEGLSSSSSVTIKLDKTKASTSVTSALTVVRDLGQTIDGVATDNLSGVNAVTVTLTDALGAPTALEATCTGCGTPAATWTVSAPASLQPGVYTVTAASDDVAGNAGDASDPVSILIV